MRNLWAELKSKETVGFMKMHFLGYICLWGLKNIFNSGLTGVSLQIWWLQTLASGLIFCHVPGDQPQQKPSSVLMAFPDFYQLWAPQALVCFPRALTTTSQPSLWFTISGSNPAHILMRHNKDDLQLRFEPCLGYSVGMHLGGTGEIILNEASWVGVILL